MSTQAEYSDGDKLYGVDMDNIVEALSKDGVLTGWTLAQNATPNMSVDVAAGTGFSGGVYNTTVSTSNIAIAASHGSLDRLDIIVVNNAGTISAITGTPAASPNPPDLPDNNICLAIIKVDATVTAIYDGDIISKRFLMGSIKKEMIDYTENRTFQGTVNFQDTLKLEAAKRLGFCFSGSTVVGEIYADSTSSLRFTSNLILGSAKSFKFGDGSDILAEFVAASGTFYLKDTGSNNRYQHIDGGNTEIKAPGGDIILNPSGKVYTRDHLVVEGQLQKNAFTFELKSTTHDYLWVKIETSSGDGGGIIPELTQKGSVGSSANTWNSVRACNLNDICSEFEVPKNALTTLDSIMMPEIGAKLRDKPNSHVLKSDKLPEFLRGKDDDGNPGHMRSVTATVSFLQGCIVELKELIETHIAGS